jgi:hypothetical protein
MNKHPSLYCPAVIDKETKFDNIDGQTKLLNAAKKLATQLEFEMLLFIKLLRIPQSTLKLQSYTLNSY